MSRWRLASIVSIALAACIASPPAPTAAPQLSTAAPDTPPTVAQIQAVLETQHAALLGRDLAAYELTYDRERSSFRRCMLAAFEERRAPPTRVERIDTYAGYARAWIQDGDGLVRRYFRHLDARWVQTEPLESEVGTTRSKTVGPVEVRYSAIDDDVAEALVTGSREAHEIVWLNQLGIKSPPFAIRFYPTRSVSRAENCFAAGTYLTRDDHVRFYLYSFTSDRATLTATTRAYIAHEGLHWEQEQFSAGLAARLDWWLREGWPDHVSGSRSKAEKTSALCAGPIPTYKELAIGPRDDIPGTPLAVSTRYYALASTMIEHLHTRWGTGAYRQLIVLYGRVADPEVNLPLALGVTPDEFRTGWIEFAKKRYC